MVNSLERLDKIESYLRTVKGPSCSFARRLFDAIILAKTDNDVMRQSDRVATALSQYYYLPSPVMYWVIGNKIPSNVPPMLRTVLEGEWSRACYFRPNTVGLRSGAIAIDYDIAKDYAGGSTWEFLALILHEVAHHILYMKAPKGLWLSSEEARSLTQEEAGRYMLIKELSTSEFVGTFEVCWGMNCTDNKYIKHDVEPSAEGRLRWMEARGIHLY